MITRKIKLLTENPEDLSLYKRLQYLQSDGNQGILTDNVFFSANTGYELKYNNEQNAESTDVYCYLGEAVNKNQVVYAYGTNLQIERAGKAISKASARGTHILKQQRIRNGVVITQLDGVLFGTMNGVTQTQSSTTPISIFGTTYLGVCSHKSAIKLYYLKITENDVLTHHFVGAIRKEDNKYGLLDLVEDRFYVNCFNSATDFTGAV